MSLVKLYRNGSFRVSIDTETGTKIISGDTEPGPEFPDTIDLKITDFCDHSCPFCYESSGSHGRHCDLGKLKKAFNKFPKVPVEIAFGGGNPIRHPDYPKIKRYFADKGCITNLTLHWSDIKTLVWADIEGISGIGISIGNMMIRDLMEFISSLSIYIRRKNLVFHCIIGITPIEDISYLLTGGYNVLLLGYKNMGRAREPLSPETVKLYERFVKTWIHIGQGDSGTLSLDCLGSTQINLYGALLGESWDSVWMGKDFSHSMFIDAVTGTLYPSSTAPRDSGVSWDSMTIIDYFKENHVKDFNGQ